MLRTSTILLGLLIAAQSLAQTSSQRASVPLSAVVQKNPAMITLSWTSLPSTTSITIYRKLKTATSWGSAIANPSASSLSYQDNSVVVGTAYEYRVVRVSAGVTGQGYICTGIEVPLADYKGKMILLVDNTFTSTLAAELAQLQNDLRADGWAVVRSDVSRAASVSSVRNTVISHYNSDPANVKALFIIGHVPVPYSGNLNPDGHGEHLGAWPCDGYYGELNGTWTDNSVNSQGGQRVQNHNVPGDGKLDQSYFPSDLELQVGRVDMYDMPAFNQTETQLLSAYLTKSHNYKIKQWTPTARGIIFDNLQWVSNPLSASGWRNLIPMVGSANITAPDPYAGNFSNYINNQSYLWTYNSGGGLQAYEGSVVTYNGADLVGTTQTYASLPYGGVFNMSFGSYYGDWDNKNNFLRAPLASGNGLVNCYASIPAWYFHHMGLGENIGYSALVTMNNNSLYTPITDGWQSSIGKAHLGLMGDPSLRQKMIAPPSNLSITNASGTAAFSWTAASGSPDGYHIYRFDATTGVITRLTTNAVTGTSYSSGTIPFVSGAQYMVRAVKLQVDPSGSYQNLSLGAIGTAAGSAPVDCLGVPGGSAVPGSACNDGNACTINDVRNASCQCVGTSITPSATITPSGSTGFCAGGSVVLNASTGTGYTYAWQRNGTTISGASGSSYTATQAGSYTVTVTNAGCGITSNAINVTVTAQPSATISAGGPTGFCPGGSVVLSASTGTGYTYVWKRNGTTISSATGSSYTATQAGSYTVTVSSVGCSATSAATAVTVGTAPPATITAAGSATFCTGGSVVLNANTGTGYTYAWKRNGTTISGATSSSYSATQAGSYTVTVSNAGCATTSAGTTVTVNAAPNATLTAGGATSFCTGGSVALSAITGTGYAYVWKRNGTTISGATGSSYTASLAGSYTVTITSGGCTATSSAIAVTVSMAPSASMTAGSSTTFCSGGVVTLTANSGTGYTYQWKLNGTNISGATGISHNAVTAGSYAVTVANGGCSNTSSAMAVTVNPLPTATCSSNASSATVSAVGSGTLAPYTYSWNTSPVQTGATATVSASGSYVVTVTDARGCRGSCTSSITLVPPVSCSGTRTETQTTWGATASSGNPAAYLTSNFATAFPAPNHLTIGCGNRTLKLTTAAAVTAFLPSSGPTTRLPFGVTQNPGTSYGNTLAGQLVALKLSVRFDELSASFSPSNTLLKNMVIASGTFSGWTVQALIDAADSKIGGCGGAYSRATLNAAITAVNEGYAGGTVSSGYLACPASGMLVQNGTIEVMDVPEDELLEVSVFPNPLRGTATFVIMGAAGNGTTTLELFSVNGVRVGQLFNGTIGEGVEQRVQWDAGSQMKGMYFYRVISGDRTATGKVVVE